MRSLATLFAVLGLNCASSSVPAPTPERPVLACLLSCPDGYSIRRQHLCRNGKRWFEDIRIIGEYVKRAVDGTIATAVWIARDSQGLEASYDKQDVEIGSCSQVIDRIIAGRSVEQRGQHPGEDPRGRPQ